MSFFKYTAIGFAFYFSILGLAESKAPSTLIPENISQAYEIAKSYYDSQITNPLGPTCIGSRLISHLDTEQEFYGTEKAKVIKLVEKTLSHLQIDNVNQFNFDDNDNFTLFTGVKSHSGYKDLYIVGILAGEKSIKVWYYGQSLVKNAFWDFNFNERTINEMRQYALKNISLN